jgi:hypothetical protein
MTNINKRTATLALFLCVFIACRLDYPALAPLSDGAIDTTLAEHMMLVLIDTTGSMAVSRIDTSTRLEAAEKLAKGHILSEARTAAGLAGVAIYTFYGTGIEAKTLGFIDPVTASNTIDTLVLGSGLSPVAGSMCDAIDTLVASGDATITKMLEIYIDGGENNTPSSHFCYGPSSNGDFSPFDIGSWQNKVLTRAINSGVQISITLFTYTPSALLSDPNFFSTLALSTGGQFRLVFDDGPLPAFADLNGD